MNPRRLWPQRSSAVSRPTLASMVKDELGYKYHWAVADYLQRSARHIASQTDVDQAYALGEAAVELALAGQERGHALHRSRQGQSATAGRIAEAPLRRR